MKGIYNHLQEAEKLLYEARLDWKDADDIARDMWRIVYWAEENQPDEELEKVYACADKLEAVATKCEDRMEALEEIVDALFKADWLIDRL